MAAVTRLLDRLLARYNEYDYSGAYVVTVSDPSGRGKESVDAGIVRTARDAFTTNGVVFGCLAARQALFLAKPGSSCRTRRTNGSTATRGWGSWNTRLRA